MNSGYGIAIVILLSACAQPQTAFFDAKAEEAAVREVLRDQETAWNKGDLEGFMAGYWKSDSLQFMSPRGINRGWQATLDGYKKGYPDVAAMGTLQFEILQVTPLSTANFLVTGKYHLTRASGNLDGVFTLVFKKANGRWVVMYDHTA